MTTPPQPEQKIAPRHWERIKKACDLAQQAGFYGEIRFHFQKGVLIRFDVFQQNKIEPEDDIEKKLRTVPLA